VRAAALLGLLAASAVHSQEDPGRKVFTQLAQPPCALCHALKAAGAAGTVGPSLDELKPDKARVLEVVRAGLGPMPPYADKLTPEQIEAVAAYVAKAAQAP
jgi:mono/diheme cytochrome c family protein